MPNEARLSVDILDPINKAALVRAVKLRYYKAIMKAKPKIENDLKRAIGQTGIMGFIPFTLTDLWVYLNTKEALAELGFITKKPLNNLIESLKQTVVVNVYPNKIAVRMVDLELLASLTIHPSAGKGLLGEVSWFVDWVINGIPVDDYTFMITGPPRPRSSLSAGKKAGLMIKNVSGAGNAESPGGFEGGFWQFPPEYKNAIDDWLDENIYSIKAIVFNHIKKAIE
jgi:hypothetical protein